ncbi:hypothetical protein [Turicibacter sanguinis]|uniref:hypothetical protein n=1 Tax=Turicibacter sanguinis TaxID=154288 RepID=UPI00233061EE|nr:hypothetical protein [Turicibacter sanguinis]MDB8576225.1 hypothetical protein [Turicibacter sanguinis]MDB8579257.1 hypothetical protein [Turicibacter sanguinis]MDB8584945.1 hypothetical protein [Turicibacter sanguinis]MDB8588147.1 hypothetical protein [Turicibacter sanguinis]MDB8599003.1 hypothetical protein [Turicibacter sanguinis]
MVVTVHLKNGKEVLLENFKHIETTEPITGKEVILNSTSDIIWNRYTSLVFICENQKTIFKPEDILFVTEKE